MYNRKVMNTKTISTLTLIIVFLCVVGYCVYLQFLSPTLYGTDSYYHAAVARFIKDFGPRYHFRWTQFSTFNDFFSDKGFLFHLLVVPFLYLTDNIVLAAKYAVIFYNILFILIYIMILKRYLPNFLVALFLLLPFLSVVFSIYFIYLRPATLMNILIILGIYCLINKKWQYLFFISLAYSFSHLSFFILIIFAFICEIIRYIRSREFFLKNIYAVLVAVLLGFLIHPNNPNNLLNFYLNGILVPFHVLTNRGIMFGSEFYTASVKIIFSTNYGLFLTLNIVVWFSFLSRIRLKLATLVWWACTNVFLVLSFLGNRYWYNVNVLFFIFFASYLNDWIGDRNWRAYLKQINIFIAIYLIFTLLFNPFKDFIQRTDAFIKKNYHYENVARWMNANIPEGETIYHSIWSDSAYFICLNPKNNYLVVLDPIYMIFHNGQAYLAYRDLYEGRISNPFELIRKMFKTSYGYTRKSTLLYPQVINNPDKAKIIYEDNLGVVFKIIDKEGFSKSDPETTF